MNSILLEVCAGSVTDCVVAHECGVKRVELSNALYLGGLTPTTAMIDMVHKMCPGLEISAMVRPRGAGFCYSEVEFAQMKMEAEGLIASDADAIVFGILNKDYTFNKNAMTTLADMAHEYGKKAIVHRAFDCVKNQDEAIEMLIEIGIDRVLTSGGAPNVMEGIEGLLHLQKDYGDKIEILAGSGVKVDNVVRLIEQTGVTQVHSSCGGWFEDVTTDNGKVSYAYDNNHAAEYDGTDKATVLKMLDNIAGIGGKPHKLKN